MNTTDASMGNVISGNQVRALPLEARQRRRPPQPAAGRRIPAELRASPTTATAPSAARARTRRTSRSTALTSRPGVRHRVHARVRTTLDSLEEFRVTTSNYGADSGRSSSAQVSLVTKSGTNDYPRRRLHRPPQHLDLVERVLQQAGGLSRCRKLDKQIYGGSLGGPHQEGQAVLLRQLRALEGGLGGTGERSVPSETMRDGVLVYQCRNAAQCPARRCRASARATRPAGSTALTPGELAVARPARHRPERPRTDYFSSSRSERSGPRRSQHHDLPLYGALETRSTPNRRVDYRRREQQLFRPVNVQRDTRRASRSIPARRRRTPREGQELGVRHRLGQRPRSNIVNTFRYGFTKIVDDTLGTPTRPSTISGSSTTLTKTSRTPAPRDADPQLRRRPHLDQGLAHAEVRRRTCASPGSRPTSNIGLVQLRPGQRILGVRRRPRYIPGRVPLLDAGLRRAARGGAASRRRFADSWIDIIGIMSRGRPAVPTTTGPATCCREGDAVRAQVRLRRIRVLRAGQLAGR